MARRAKKRSRERKVSQRGMGWLWPAQPCGKKYKDFRSGTTFAEAYEWLAYRANERGETFRPSKKRIIGAMAQIKRSMYEEYEKGCRVAEQGGPPSRTWADCRKVCKARSNACGKSCVSKKKKCKKLPPETGICNITDFQTNLDLETAAAEGWEAARAAGAAMPDAGDTSFDFVVNAPEPFPPADDMDFGYEPPTKYGFKGLRGRGVPTFPMGRPHGAAPGSYFLWTVPFTRPEFREYHSLWHAKNNGQRLTAAQKKRLARLQKSMARAGIDSSEMPALPVNVQFADEGLAGGRGGAAANRGKYKPLPPGQSAIEQVRALELARADIIRAIESGQYELCKRGEKRAAAPEAVDQRSHGQRTASEIEAIRKRYERAGY